MNICGIFKTLFQEVLCDFLEYKNFNNNLNNIISIYSVVIVLQITPRIVIGKNKMVLLPKINELKSLFSFEEVPVGDYIYDLQIRSDIAVVAEKQVGNFSL